MDQEETWHAGRPQPHCVRWVHSYPQKGAYPQFSAHVYCGQTARWIKMPLGREVDLSPGNIVLDGDPTPQKRGMDPQFSAHVYCGQMVAHLSCCWALVQLYDTPANFNYETIHHRCYYQQQCTKSVILDLNQSPYWTKCQEGKTIMMSILHFWQSVCPRCPTIHQISGADISCSHYSYNTQKY